jgi:hypothetical protein
MFPVTRTSLFHHPSQLLLFAIDELIKGQFVLLQHSSWAGALLPPTPLIPIANVYISSMSLTTLLLSCLGPSKEPVMSVSQSVSPSVRLLNKYYSVHPEKAATKKHVGNGPYLPIATYTPIDVVCWFHLLFFLLITAFAGSTTNAGSER